jgi:hypothetical protein
MDWGVRYLTLTLTLTQKSGGKEKLTLEGICDFIFVTLEGFYCSLPLFLINSFKTTVPHKITF